MTFTAEQANAIFGIILDKGNFDKRYPGMVEEKRHEFVESVVKNHSSEYWYPSANGSSFKVFTNAGFGPYPPKVQFYAQTINSVHEKGLVKNMEEAFAGLFG